MTVRLAVRVHPGARRSGLEGWMGDGSLKLSVAAAPEGGRANLAVVRLVAESLGVTPAQVHVTRGASSRAKTLEIEGLEESEVRVRLERALENGTEGGGTRGSGTRESGTDGRGR